MFTKVSVLIPTRHRIERLRTLLASYERTAQGVEQSSELVFRADDDDVETLRFLEGRHVIAGPRLKGYESLPQFFNELAFAASGDTLMLGNDDMVFVTQGWAARILEAANRFPDGVFNVGVRTHNETHFPFSTVSRRVAEHLGFLYDPRIFWGDIFLRDVMGALGRNVMLDDVEIQHVWAGNDPDQTFLQGEGARRAPGNWMTHHAQAVEEAVERLRGLVSQ
ncbi:MAG: glycosyltransferase [Sulfuricaulis sp.]|nr:glycosyltransferase [Sulfuricaulis sp.]